MSYGESNIGQAWRGYYITAYGIAVKHGYTGTEAEWLNSLVGRQGDTGVGIASVELNDNYTLTVTCTDGSSYTTGSIRGEPGQEGQQGQQGNPGATGTTGATGNGIASIALQSGNHAPGTTDIYRVTYTGGGTFDYQVYNGADGSGVGDMLASVYDPQGNARELATKQALDAHTQDTDAHASTEEKAAWNGKQAALTAGTNITIVDSVISATGGLYPQIIVTAPTGSAVTCQKGSTTLTAAEASGTWTFIVPDYGTWTVNASLGGDSASESVNVDTVKQYTLTITYQVLSDTFADNEWSAIIGACQSGSVPAAWVVGNQKAMNINGASYTVTIIGKGHDTYTAGGTAPLTFQLQDCYGTKYQMNSSDTNSGGWTNCAMRSTHLPTILALMPTEVKAAIREVNKLSSAGSQSATINTTADKLFLLSEIEIFGSITNSKSGEGSQYAYYSAGNSKVKNFDGSASGWWGRSPRGSGSTAFCSVSSSCNAFSGDASGSYGVAFGFCF